MSDQSLQAMSSISALLNSSDADWRIYDLNQNLRDISQESFNAFEQTTIPYPFPLHKKANFAVVFRAKALAPERHTQMPFIWFLTFNLDEAGKLQQPERDHFISLVVAALGTQLLANNEQNSLDNHPYSFKPNDYKMASLTSKIRVDLQLPPTQFYAPAISYFHQQGNNQAWEQLAVQGIADFAFRLNENTNAQKLSERLPELPIAVFEPLSQILENVQIPTFLAEKLTWLGKTARNNGNERLALACLHSLCGAKENNFRREWLSQILNSTDVVSGNLLLIICARCPQELEETALRHHFYNKLLTNTQGEGYSEGILKSLLHTPHIGELVRNDLKQDHIPAHLAQIIRNLA